MQSNDVRNRAINDRTQSDTTSAIPPSELVSPSSHRWGFGIASVFNPRCDVVLPLHRHAASYLLTPATCRRLSRTVPVCTENLSSGVVVMKSAQDGV
jgi:hypothetical protein